MNETSTVAQLDSAASDRLLEMLALDSRWPEPGKGLAKKIQQLIPQFSYATVFKWSNDNSLPRTADERRIVASTLGVDLVYWEYGVKSQGDESVSARLQNYDPISALKHSNAVSIALNNRGLKVGSDIDDHLLLRLQELVYAQSVKYQRIEPDMELIEGLIEIVLSVKKT